MLILDKARALDRMIYAASTARIGVPDGYGQGVEAATGSRDGGTMRTARVAGRPVHGAGSFAPAWTLAAGRTAFAAASRGCDGGVMVSDEIFTALTSTAGQMQA